MKKSLFLLFGLIFILSNDSLHGFSIFKPFPKLTGQHLVGSSSYHWTDISRGEQPRELMIKVWYPAAINQCSELFPYMPAKMAALKNKYKVPGFLWNSFIGGVKTYAIPDSEMVFGSFQEDFPVIIFSHGLGGNVDFYSAYLEDLASHGYIVIGIDHTNSCNISVFSDDRVVYIDKKFEPKNHNWLNQRWFVDLKKENKEWQKDILFVFDKLKVVNEDSTDKFYKKLNLEKVGMFGHSMGGMAAVEVCRQNSRFKVGISLDGWNSDLNSTSGIATPFLFLQGGKSLYGGLAKKPSRRRLSAMKMNLKEYKKWGKKMREGLSKFCKNSGENCKRKIIKKAGHATFCDVVLLKFPFKLLLNIDIGNAKTYKTIREVRQSTRTFFDEYLL